MMKVKEKKVDYIQIRIGPEAKKRLKEKAESLSLNISQFIEKVANDSIVFIPENVRVILEAKQ